MSDYVGIKKLLAAHQPGHSMAGPFYTDPAVYEADMEVIFGRHWIFLASTPELAEAGDYLTFQLGKWPIVLVRDDDMEIKAFHNVCRHRGAKLLTESKGFVGNLVCPYHTWTYDLTGALVHAEGQKPEFDKSCYSLKPVAVRVLGGLIYVCLAEHPPEDFTEMAGIVSPYVNPHRLADCKVAAQTDLIEHGNWKLTIENNRECYHCAGHPELGKSLFTYFGFDPGTGEVSPGQRAYYDKFKRTYAEFEQIWAREGLPKDAVEQLSGRPTGFRTERLAIDAAGESYTMDGRVACRKLLPGIKEKRLGGLHLHTQPNAWFHFLSDHILTFATIPVSVDKTLVRTTWLVHKDAIEGVDYDLERLTEVWNATNKQDAHFVELVQQGALSPSYQPGPYAPSEYQVDEFVTWYTQRLHTALG